MDHDDGTGITGATGGVGGTGIQQDGDNAVETLLNENKVLAREIKKLERELEKERTLIQRYRGTSEAKKQFAEVVLAERTRLEMQMNLLLQNSRDFILFFDADRHLILCTDSLLKALGILGIGLIKGKSFEEIFGSRLPDTVLQTLKGHFDGAEAGEGTEHFETHFSADLGDGNEPRDYSLEVSLMRDSAKVRQGWLFFFYDNTDLVRAKYEAERANEAKSDFLAKISHDIRSPMNAVIGLSKMIEATSLDENQRGLLEKIQASSDGLLALINDLLDFSKIEAGKLEIIDEYFRLGDLLDDLKSLFEVMLAQKEIAFHVHCGNDLPEVICSDEKRIRQILINLMNNAYKYTPSGWVDFTVTRVGEGLIGFEVHDTGIGIREDEADRLFGAFEMLDIKRNRDITGTGLGLAIVKQLAELMGGSVGVQSVYGEGSTFTVVLPLKEGTPDDLPKVEIEYHAFKAPDAKVLIVDDVEVNIVIAEFMLEPFGVQVASVSDGKQALELVQKEHFDLILMDHMMPVMDGVEATRAIRGLDGPVSEVAIVAMTANAVSGVVEMFLAAGFNGYVSKPMSEAALSTALYEHLPKALIRE
ncbi:MAG: response regulator [Coriobacteriales bacterium]|jgi:signal transduction histidine kinase/ActR/RegA family two-component response regulator|nr:response regulator [Coriobacteriales bacterium]